MKKTNQSFANLERAVRSLRKAISTPPTEERDFAGIIQNFEFCFELTWKTLKLVLESNGIAAPFPRIAFEEAFTRNMIDGNEVWKEITDARNLSSHTYDETLAKQLCALIMSRFVLTFENTVEKIRPFITA